MAVQQQLISSYNVGLLFILAVSIIWTASSFLVQNVIYCSQGFQSPFVVTYVGTSLFSMLLPLYWISLKAERARKRQRDRRSYGGHIPSGDAEDSGIPWDNRYNTGSAHRRRRPHDHDDEKESGCLWCNNYDDQISMTAAASAAMTNSFSKQNNKDERNSACKVGEEYISDTDDDVSEYTNNDHSHSQQELQQQLTLSRTLHEDFHSLYKSSTQNSNVTFTNGYYYKSSSTVSEEAIPISPAQLSLPQHRKLQQLERDIITTSSTAATTSDNSPSETKWGHVQHFQTSLQIAPIWFLSNWAYNWSLGSTSISSSTVLSSTSGFFTYVFAVLTKEERLTGFKVCGVGLCFLGSILTGLVDASNDDGSGSCGADAIATVIDDTVPINAEGFRYLQSDENYTPNTSTYLRAWGDAASLLSAVGYGLYTVLIKYKCPKNEKLMSMQLLFGYIGLINCIALSPFMIYWLWHYNVNSNTNNYQNEQGTISEDTTTTTALTWTILGLLILKGSFDNVLSDYLWARSIVLTSATVATVGVGMTIPMAFLVDWVFSAAEITIESGLSALLVLVGFALVNLSP